MPKTVNRLEPKDSIATIMAASAIVIALRGWAEIHPDMLCFVDKYFSVGNESQKIVAGLLTVIFQTMMICVIGCSYWSLLLVEKDAPNPYFPVVYVCLPMLMVMYRAFSSL